MITVKELRKWLDTLSADEQFVYIDDGGLTLAVFRSDAYIEVGGYPDPDLQRDIDGDE